MSKLARVSDALDREYGRQKWTDREPVLDELIGTILSQNTTSANSRKAFARLRERFPTWESAMRAPTEEIADAIRPGGLANRKAPRIKAILSQVYDRQANLDIDWVADLPNAEAMEYLMEFDGVGRKTAACVLMFGLGRPVLPVDTHVHRVSTRLGLIGRVSAEKAHDILGSMVPAERVYSFHVNMVTHGRRVCHARSPECERCIIREECDYFTGKAGTGR